MPERIAVQRLIVGEGKTRRVIMPGEAVTLDSETAAVLDQRDPPVVRDPGGSRPEVEMAPRRDRLAHAAEPIGDRGTDNITRERPVEAKDEDEL